MSPNPREFPGRSSERRAVHVVAALALLMGGADRILAAASANPAPSLPYQVYHPDVVEIKVSGRPDLTSVQTVGTDGRVALGALGRLRVDGRTASEIADLVEQASQVPDGAVSVRVTEYKSQQIYLFGAVSGAQRPVPYQGGEPVLHLLQRVGGIKPGAEPNDIYVVRTRLAAGRPPQVFHIQYRDIVSGKDARSNLVLQPFDEVYVGETRKSCFFKCLPPVLRPFFRSVCGMPRPGTAGPAGDVPAEPARVPLKERIAALNLLP